MCVSSRTSTVAQDCRSVSFAESGRTRTATVMLESLERFSAEPGAVAPAPSDFGAVAPPSFGAAGAAGMLGRASQPGSRESGCSTQGKITVLL